MTREQAERKIEAKKRFVSVLSEELQDAIRGYDFNDNCLEATPKRTRLKALIKMIRRESLYLEKLINNWYEMEV